MRETKRAPSAKQAVRDAFSEGAQPTIIDRVINYFDPVRGAQRMRARMTQALVGGYVGGSRARRSMSAWQTSQGASADADLLPDLPTLRDRSRDLVRNAPIAGGALNTIAVNVVGTGLMLQSRVLADVLGMNEGQASAWQRRTEQEFALWCGSPECDITRTQDFYELQDLVFRATLESGDAFSVLPSMLRPGNPYALKIQLIEADRVCNPNFAIDKPTLAGGVEMDDYGAPIRYHILRQHPGSLMQTSRTWDVYEAFGTKTGRRNVLHHFKRLRIGLSRGEPMLAPVIETLKQLDRYTEAEIMAAVVSGLFTVFVHSEGPGLDLANQQAMGAETGAKTSDADAKLGNGAIIDLGINEKIESANPGRPNTAFDPFVMAILRQVGMRLGLPYEVLVMHFTASYSAARAALLQAWKFFMVRRAWLAASFCQPIYETFLAEAVARGRIAAPGFFTNPLVRMAYCNAEWQGDGMPAIQPLQEAEAIAKRMEIQLTTLQDETAAYNGRDWEANIAQAKRERVARDMAGLSPQSQSAGPANPPGEAPQPADQAEQY